MDTGSTISDMAVKSSGEIFCCIQWRSIIIYSAEGDKINTFTVPDGKAEPESVDVNKDTSDVVVACRKLIRGKWTVVLYVYKATDVSFAAPILHEVGSGKDLCGRWITSKELVLGMKSGPRASATFHVVRYDTTTREEVWKGEFPEFSDICVESPWIVLAGSWLNETIAIIEIPSADAKYYLTCDPVPGRDFTSPRSLCVLNAGKFIVMVSDKNESGGRTVSAIAWQHETAKLKYVRDIVNGLKFSSYFTRVRLHSNRFMVVTIDSELRVFDISACL